MTDFWNLQPEIEFFRAQNATTVEPLFVQIFEVEKADLALVTKSRGWLFDWKSEAKKLDRRVFKCVLKNGEGEIEGLLSLISREMERFVEIGIIETAPQNFGKGKFIDSVPGCLLAFACGFSLKIGFDGNVYFRLLWSLYRSVF